MKIIIIEDEKLTAEDLAETIQKIEPNSEIIAIISSVDEGLKYFEKQVEADLIFSDIQLGDGQSFEIFEKTQTSIPVVFCTAYDEYALNAFKTNSIDYILKPYSEKTIRESLEKFKSLKKTFSSGSLDALIKSLDSSPKVNSILVHYKEQIIPISVKEIAFFYIRNEVVLIKTLDSKTYILNKTLDDYESKLGSMFFRANRQYLVNRQAVRSAENYGARKLALLMKVQHEETITVSKEKHTPLMNWLEEVT